MLAARTQTRLTLILMVGVTAIVLGGLGWLAWRSPSSRFLPPHAGARWIRYPLPPQIAIVVDQAEQHTVFERTFNLSTAPAQARLDVCAFRHCTVQLNGQALTLPEAGRWNQVRSTEVSGLRAGTNELRVVAGNQSGPPALWLRLQGPGCDVGTDEHWLASLNGAAQCAACPAEQPVPLRAGNPDAGATQTLPALQACWPWLLVFALVIAGSAYVLQTVVRKPEKLPRALRGLTPLTAGLCMVSLLWVLLFAQNTLVAPRYAFGYDLADHLDYIRYIQDRHALPLANEGWEMHHPPLFYLISAGVLTVCHLTPTDPNALLVFRSMGLIFGLVQLTLVAGCVRLLFPGQPRRQLVALALAAFLPAQLAIYHYTTNESLLITLGTAALYVCLRVLTQERVAPGWYALLGLCLGAALLTKVTAIVVAGVVLLVVAGRLVVRRQWQPSAWLRSVGITVAVMVLACGWYYGRVWAHFGTPLVSNYDQHTRFQFWMHPGYGTPDYFLHFGRSLTDPFFASLYSVPDGLYSTFWGDGLLAGVAAWSNRPPWNYDLMATGYLLALLPTALIGLGLAAALVQLARRPRAEWFLLLGMLAGLAVALFYLLIQFPYNGHAKAIYELTGLLTACALAGWGFDLLARLGKVPALVLTVLFGVWAATAYASLWIRPDSAETQNWAGLRAMSFGRSQYATAESHFRHALAADPHCVPARLNWARLLLEALALARQNGNSAAAQQLEKAARELTDSVLRDDPTNADALTGRAMFAKSEGRMDDALADLRLAEQQAPDHVDVYFIRGSFLYEQRRLPDAEAAYRQALRLISGHPSAHANLGLVLARQGKVDEAIAHYRHALALQPDQADWRADLAWLLVTAHPNDLPEARRLADEACTATNNQDAYAVRALAACQATAGNYKEALATARRAVAAATSPSLDSLKQALDQQAQCYEQGKPFTRPELFRDHPYPALLARRAGE